MITKKQVQELQPAPFKPVLAYTRYKNWMIVPNTKPRLKRLCPTCNSAKRKAERNALKPKKVYTIPKATAKRKEENKAYTPLRKKYLEDHPECQVKLLGICTGKALEIHHVSTSHKDFLNIKTWKSSCPACHRHLETVLSAEVRRNSGLLI